MEQFFYSLEAYLKTKIRRSTFLKIILGGFTYYISNSAFLKMAFAKTAISEGRKKREVTADYDLVLAEGPDPYANMVNAVNKMGDMDRFVKKGDIVVVKPNMAWDRSVEQGANTDPMVVSALVEMAYKAGAKQVKVFDAPCNDEKRCHENTGIAKAAAESGAKVSFVNHWDVVKCKFPYKSPMEGWPVFREAVDCDVFINAPVLKHHRLTTLTLAMKNLMGICSGTRGMIHIDIGGKLVDITDFIKPDLNVIDGTRYLQRNGPSGGNLEDVVRLDKVIVSTDATLADTFAADLVKVDPNELPNLKAAYERGFGITDISKARIAKI
ncbi:MAG: DUF362 domain-containing protein [Candidatus Omnitrophota bacterium]